MRAQVFIVMIIAIKVLHVHGLFQRHKTPIWNYNNLTLEDDSDEDEVLGVMDKIKNIFHRSPTNTDEVPIDIPEREFIEGEGAVPQELADIPVLDETSAFDGEIMAYEEKMPDSEDIYRTDLENMNSYDSVYDSENTDANEDFDYDLMDQPTYNPI